MDPLSVAASIAGLLALAGKIASTLTTSMSSISSAPDVAIHVRNETESLRAMFAQLQTLLLQQTPRNNRFSTISVDQLVVVLTGCLMAFSELEVEWGHQLTTQAEATMNEMRLQIKKLVQRNEELMVFIQRDMKRHSTSQEDEVEDETWRIRPNGAVVSPVV
ncbi:hypothetical protein BDD12DRAFT_909663 [Trichophaea hybrida]|nr:hypothetical protein BDD12DRAFT_909663 [Trichophaea hybrida]